MIRGIAPGKAAKFLADKRRRRRGISFALSGILLALHTEAIGIMGAKLLAVPIANYLP